MELKRQVACGLVKDAPVANDLLSACADPGVTSCAVHLQFLESLVILRVKVEDWGRKTNQSSDLAWETYVDLAARRFVRWSREVHLADMNKTLPPHGTFIGMG